MTLSNRMSSLISAGTGREITEFFPHHIPNCVIWYSANSGNFVTSSGKISEIIDMSRGKRRASQSTAGFRTNFSYLNSVPTFNFDGADDYYDISNIIGLATGNSESTVFVVGALNPVGSSNVFAIAWGDPAAGEARAMGASETTIAPIVDHAGGNDQEYSADWDPELAVFEFVHEVSGPDTQVSVYKAGILLQPSPITIATSTTLTRARLGDGVQVAAGTNLWAGQIVDVAVFSRKLSDDERERVRLYFRSVNKVEPLAGQIDNYVFENGDNFLFENGDNYLLD